MGPTAVQHSAAADLAAYARGKLPLAVAETVRSHIDACDTCRTAVEHTPPEPFATQLHADQPVAAVTTPQGLNNDTFGLVVAGCADLNAAHDAS